MGFDCGFDIYPRLNPSNAADKQAYQAFLDDIMATYQDAHDSEGRREDGKVLQMPGDPDGKFYDKSYIYFMVGEWPRIPANAERCDYFLRFSSKVSGQLSACAEPYLRGVHQMAKQRFGVRVHWWHELNDEAEDDRKWRGYYSWTEVYAASDELKALEAGKGVEKGVVVDPESGGVGDGDGDGLGSSPRA
ncbi:hypothetical protein C8A05DRAFT_46997 [Staphylotrichum tortipilum]|uniref:Uncharacterized protein n=1 Tax=Staphylotrichum tortipilum TaxID=2831512 RepID=A0AAN6MEI2_9PEZI|nr:hypothetical protein C8A05DRAFT_46997 [Staphylotrichum longicolle]